MDAGWSCSLVAAAYKHMLGRAKITQQSHVDRAGRCRLEEQDPHLGRLTGTTEAVDVGRMRAPIMACVDSI